MTKQNVLRYSSLALGILALALAVLLLFSGCGNQAADTTIPEPAPQSPDSGVTPPAPQSPDSGVTPPAPQSPDSGVTPPAPQSPDSGVTPPAPDSAVTAPSSAATAPPQSPDSGVTPPWWQEFFGCSNLYELAHEFYLHDNTQKISYWPWSNHELECLAAAIVGSTEMKDLGEPIMEDMYVEVVMKSDDKYAVRFYEKGIELTRSHWKVKEKTMLKLAPTRNDYNKLKQALDELQGAKEAPPLWLSMMNRGRITALTVVDPAGGKITYNTKSERNNAMLYQAEPFIRGILVEPGSAQSGGTDFAILDSAYRIKILFENGVIYDVAVDKEQLQIKSSDVDYSLTYSLANAEQDRKNLQKVVYKELTPGTTPVDNSFTPNDPMTNPDTGKPVIYLYPQKQTDCTVTVDYDSFTYTYPTYNNGWQVTAYPDGRLVNKADGSEHYYLFWEGNKQIDWRFESGFVIAGRDTEKFLREKLAYLGLTAREYNDFITYWVPKMQDNAYNLITFAGEQYEQLASLTVTPTPDSVLRVHMVYKAIDKPVEIAPQTLTPFTRKGFTVVEWGGTVTR